MQKKYSNSIVQVLATSFNKIKELAIQQLFNIIELYSFFPFHSIKYIVYVTQTELLFNIIKN